MVNYNHADYFGVKGIDCVNTVTYDENGVHIVRKTTWQWKDKTGNALTSPIMRLYF